MLPRRCRRRWPHFLIVPALLGVLEKACAQEVTIMAVPADDDDDWDVQPMGLNDVAAVFPFAGPFAPMQDGASGDRHLHEFLGGGVQEAFLKQLLPVLQSHMQEEAHPCDKDVAKLCPRADAVLHCLGQHADKISPPCRENIRHTVPFVCSQQIHDLCDDNLEIGTLPCLEGRGNKLGSECADAVIAARHALSSLAMSTKKASESLAPAKKEKPKDKANSWRLMRKGVAYCPAGMRIRSLSECQRAYDSLKEELSLVNTRGMQSGSWEHVPLDCSVEYDNPNSDQAPHWNTRRSSDNAKDFSGEFHLLCRQAETFTCPKLYPKCYSDGKCVTNSCFSGGCVWNQAPSATTDPKDALDMYTHIDGVDNKGQHCTGDHQADPQEDTTCPQLYPKCFSDGNCVTSDCAHGGCEWKQAPTLQTRPGWYNSIRGADNNGRKCTRSYQASKTDDSDSSKDAASDNGCPEGSGWQLAKSRNGCCTRHWTQDCAADCSKDECLGHADGAWEFRWLDFRKHPYTCCPKVSAHGSKYIGGQPLCPSGWEAEGKSLDSCCRRAWSWSCGKRCSEEKCKALPGFEWADINEKKEHYRCCPDPNYVPGVTSAGSKKADAKKKHDGKSEKVSKDEHSAKADNQGQLAGGGSWRFIGAVVVGAVLAVALARRYLALRLQASKEL